MHLRKLVENKIGNISNSEMQFAVINLNLEIEHKFKRIPSIPEMVQVLLANIEFYRKRIKNAELELAIQDQQIKK